MLQTMLASVIAASARSRPMDRIVSRMRAFWCAKTCSIFKPGADLAALARPVRFGIGRPRGFLRWMRLFMEISVSQAPFSADL